jgi:F-type H+-transporting ATPase subunit delta
MRQVDVEWKTDPQILAGAVVRAGDLVIDGSVSGELDRLRQQLAA